MRCPICQTALVAAPDYRDHACPKCGLAGPLDTLRSVDRLRERQTKVGRAYRERNMCVAALAHMAIAHGWRAGLGRHHPDPDPTWEPEWFTVLYIDLPTGQVSWHLHDQEVPLFARLPPYDPSWDGHSTPEKYDRLTALVEHLATTDHAAGELAHAALAAVGEALGVQAGAAFGERVLERVGQLQAANRDLLRQLERGRRG